MAVAALATLSLVSLASVLPKGQLTSAGISGYIEARPATLAVETVCRAAQTIAGPHHPKSGRTK